MATNDRTERQWYRYGLLALGIATLALAVLLLTASPAGASNQTDLDVGNLTVDGVNKTLEGNITGANVTTTLNYEIDVEDASRRVVRLKVGPTANDTTTLDFSNADVTADQTTGTVTLSGSLFEHADLNASALTPAHDKTRTTEIVVVAEITVTTTDGETIETVVERPVDISLTDPGGPIARLGGTGNVTVQTDATE